jgi:hypothetical protein
MKKQRKHSTPEERVAILRRHLLDKEPISKRCDDLGLQPTVFYEQLLAAHEHGTWRLVYQHPCAGCTRRISGAIKYQGKIKNP